ncbi:MAG: enoyl-CoA hydratase/isomerase family protein [Burkholderiales bacterium]
MSDVLIVADRGAVRVLTLNRPHKRNALDTALTQALLDALRAADADDNIGCVLLTGAGAAFCAGADLGEFKDLVPAQQHRVEARAELTMQLHLAFPALAKPVLTAVNGAAMGGGAGLALAGDMALMAEGAQLGYPETRHGIVAAIVMANLVRQVGRKAAFELVALGEPVAAARAAELGLVNRVVVAASLMDEAMKLAAQLAAVSRPAMSATKQLFHAAADLPLAEALERGRETNKRMRGFRRG